MIKKILLPVLLTAAMGVSVYYFYPTKAIIDTTAILATVEEGQFKVSVTSTGELQSRKSEKIRGPKGMRAAEIYQTTIADLVPEGTLVKEGDYVGRLDRSELDGKLQNLASEIEKIESQLTQTKLDTAITLRGLRDQLVNLKFSMREKALEVEQSQYEPPAVIKKVELDLERIKRDYDQQIQNYQLKQAQAEAQVREIMATLEQNTNKMSMMMDLGQDFNVKAPKDGMVIYERGWNGKVGPGSRISTWNPIIAQLPDLTDMVSKTYVNEVDISKVKVAQTVEIKVDAFPEKAYKGKVTSVANIGQQMKKFDAKVFEVTVQLLENDSILRPAMTTSNEIITKVFKKVRYIPLECLHTDSLTYVYKKTTDGAVKQEVITGMSNDNHIIVAYGLAKGDELYMSIPDHANDLRNDLPIVKLSEADRKAHQKTIQQATQKQKAVAAKKQQELEDKLKKMKEELPEEEIIILKN